MTTDFKPQLTQNIINKKINKKPLNYFLSNYDFDKFIPGASSKVVKYGELDDKYTTFEQLMPLKKRLLHIAYRKRNKQWTLGMPA